MSKLQAPLRSEFSNPDAEMIPPKTAGNRESSLGFRREVCRYAIVRASLCATIPHRSISLRNALRRISTERDLPPRLSGDGVGDAFEYVDNRKAVSESDILIECLKLTGNY